MIKAKKDQMEVSSAHSGPGGLNEEEQETEGDREGDHMEESKCILNPDVDSPLTCADTNYGTVLTESYLQDIKFGMSFSHKGEVM